MLSMLGLSWERMQENEQNVVVVEVRRGEEEEEPILLTEISR